jgi:hypothetical protein
MIECRSRKPNWVCGITDALFIKGEIRFNTKFSQSLPKSGRKFIEEWYRRLIGRYEDGISGGLPGFRIRKI